MRIRKKNIFSFFRIFKRIDGSIKYRTQDTEDTAMITQQQQAKTLTAAIRKYAKETYIGTQYTLNVKNYTDCDGHKGIIITSTSSEKIATAKICLDPDDSLGNFIEIIGYKSKKTNFTNSTAIVNASTVRPDDLVEKVIRVLNNGSY
jgi:hypothetical protein